MTMLSIVIPALNEEKCLPRLLKSIERQDFDDCEIIVADAGSEDKTREIAEQFGAEVVPGGFQSRGRNRGAERAQGDLLLFVDADKILPPGFLKKSLKEFEERELKVASFLFRYYNGRRFLDFLVGPLWNYPARLLEKVLPVTKGVILVNKELHQQLGGFDQEIKIGEDVCYVRQASRLGKFGLVKSVKFWDSARRLEQDGYFKTYLKFVLGALHILLLGPIKSDIFNYEFDHYEQ